MTAPWPEEVATLTTGPHKTTCRVVAHLSPDVTLDVENLRIGWDENRAPRVVAYATCPQPEESLLADLDPRLIVRVSILIGYVLGNGSTSEQTVATLDLRAVEEDALAGTMTLELAGLEGRVIDFELGQILGGTGSTLAQINAGIASTFTPRPSPFVVGPGVEDQVETFTEDYSAERWRQCDDWADQLGCDLYDPGDGGLNGTIRLEPRPVVASQSRHVLRTGPGGTLTRAVLRRSRESWNNQVFIRYDPGGGVDPSGWVYGYAYVLPGLPFDTAQSGTAFYAETRTGRPTLAAANRAAAAVLARQLTGGRSYSCDAIAAWWLRPGHTVTVETARNAQERLLLSRVEFTWPTNQMSLATRYPEA